MVLSRADIMAEARLGDDELQLYIDAGIVDPDSAGRFSAGDLQRVRTVRAFIEAGVPWSAIETALREGLITFRYSDAFFLPPSERSGKTYAEFKAHLGDAGALLPNVYDALGMAEPPRDRPMRVLEEECLRELLDAWTQVGGRDALLRASRLLGDHTRTTVEGWMAVWSEAMWGHLAELSLGERQRHSLELGRRLTDLLPRLLVWAEQRYLERAMTEVSVAQLEELLAMRGLGPAPTREPPGVLFVDLTGYSRLTELHGDEAAVTFSTLLREVADRVARDYGGRTVKLLGDGAILLFPNGEAGLRGGADMLTSQVWPSELPPPHIGLHAGPVIQRDGDIFGGTVNVAARLSARAEAGTFLASASAASDVDAHGLIIDPIGSLTLKNISRPLEVVRVTVAT
jgi:adenylate cyclase